MLDFEFDRIGVWSDRVGFVPHRWWVLDSIFFTPQHLDHLVRVRTPLLASFAVCLHLQDLWDAIAGGVAILCLQE